MVRSKQESEYGIAMTSPKQAVGLAKKVHVSASQAKMKGGPSGANHGNGAKTGEEGSAMGLQQRTGARSSAAKVKPV
jgi:hypothetical protein